MLRLINNLLIIVILIPVFAEKYEGPISSREKGVLDYKKELKGISKERTDQLRLFFKDIESDYAVFYDLKGNEAFFKYRKDKFDYDASERVSGLFKGQAYIIKGKFIGILNYRDKDKFKLISPRFISIDNPEFSRVVSDKESLISIAPAFELEEYKTTVLEEIIY